MRLIGPCWFAVAALLCAPASSARAQAEALERTVTAAPGRDVRVGVYTDIRPDCVSGPLPGIRLVTAPAHGTVTVKRGTLKATNFKQCLGIDVPAFVAFYHSAADFSGADTFEIEITLQNGRKQRQLFHVTVTSGGAGSGGI